MKTCTFLTSGYRPSLGKVAKKILSSEEFEQFQIFSLGPLYQLRAAISYNLRLMTNYYVFSPYFSTKTISCEMQYVATF